MSQSNDSTPAGAPDQLDPNALPPHVYHRVVGPALQVAAEVAAKRGHRYLFDDLPAMLALVDMVTRLADLYLEHYPDTGAGHRELLDNAATAACVMVFQEAKLEPRAIDQLLSALQRAWQQIQEQTVIADGQRFVAMAFSHLDEDDRAPAKHCLTQATQHAVAAIEAWQEARH